jgi:hypothetical protein
VTEARTKLFRAVSKASGEPDAGQLAAIRRYMLDDVPAEQLVVREYALAHNAIDRDNECFDEPLLAQFASSLLGKGVYIKHPTGWTGDGGPAEGRVYATRIETMSLEEARTLLREPKLTLPPDRTEVHLLMAAAFYVRTDENAALLAKHAAGIVGDVSIGFNTKNAPTRVIDDSGIELNVWRWKAPGEALEMSLIWLGAQPGARAIKSARTEANDMELKEQLDAANAEITTLKSANTATKESAGKFDAAKAALGDNAVLLDNPAQLAALVTAGKSHRDTLAEQLVAADRTKGLLGDDEAAVKAAREEYAGMPISALERMAKHAAPAKGAGGSIVGSDPNAPAPIGDVKATGPFANPLIGGAAVATA